MQRVINADTSRGALKIHEYSCYALAGATPIALLAPKGSLILNISDTVLAFAIPVHMHIAMNGVLTDYLPKVAKGPARLGLLGLTAVTYLGMMKLNLAGPGITETIRSMWHKPTKN